MPLPRFLFSVRWMMIAVALTAVAMTGWVLSERAGEYRKCATNHSMQEASNLMRSEYLE